jgi:hypothetical protein
MPRFTGNNRGVHLVLVVILILFILGALGFCSVRAEERAEREGLSVSLGVPHVGSSRCDFAGLMIAQELADRKWLAHLWTHGDGECRGEAWRANVGAGVIRTTHLGHWSIGIGVGIAEHGDRAVGPFVPDPPHTSDRVQLGANLLIRRHVGKRLVLDLHHFSSGGSTYWNAGRNMLLFGVRL